MRSADIVSRRPLSIILTGFILCFTVPLLFFHSGPFQKFEGWITNRVKTGDGIAAETPILPPLPEFFEWDTRSAFNAVEAKDVRTASIAELCRSFPRHLLKDIQPVLKTGHATVQDRLPQQFESVSACLDNLLIHSDLNEKFDGHEIIDTIADIPHSLATQSEREQRQLGSYFTLQESAANGSLSTLNMTALKGWKTDKFKFLPAISRVWKMQPEKRWYVFYEDDTYVLWDNLFRLLEQFDADVPLYFGSPSPGCYPDPETRATQVWFANGGPGFVISREAMRRLVKHDWDQKSGEYLGTKLQETYWERTLKNCCGDSLLGCVLWFHNVTLSGLWPMFQVYRPHTIPFSKQIWCQPALTMHKAHAEDTPGMWRWEWEHRQRPLIWRDMAVSYFKMAELTTIDDWDNSGRSSFKAHRRTEFYTHDPHESVAACEQACEAFPRCLQWLYHLRTCTLDKKMRYGEHREAELGKDKDVTEEEKTATWSHEQLRYKSGWMQDKVRQWIDDRPCEQVEWVSKAIDYVLMKYKAPANYLARSV